MLLLREECTLGYSVLEFEAGNSAPGPNMPNEGWTERRGEQGFLCYPGYIAFRLLYAAIGFHLEVYMDEPAAVSPRAERAITLPLRVTGSGERGILMTTYLDDWTIPVPDGLYQVTMQCGENAEDDLWATVHFNRTDTPEVKLLVIDEGLHPEYPLLIDGV